MNILQPANAFFFLGFIVQFWIRHHFIQRTKPERKRVRLVDHTKKILLAMVLSSTLLVPQLYCFTSLLSFADYDLAPSVRWAGAGIMLVSLWLFLRSHLDLGQNWSVSLELRQDHQFISRGIYRYVRHPMYSSIWLWGLAQGMMLSNWFAGWAVIPAFAVMYFVRTPREEGMMCKEFGDDYRDYMQRTGRLFPRLGKTILARRPK